MYTPPSWSTRPRLWPVAWTLIAATPIAWLTTVLLAGRALPWQASRWWALTFAAALVLCSIWLWSFARKLPARHSRQGLVVILWGIGPLVATAVVGLALIYLSDEFNALLQRPYWRMPFLAALLLLMLMLDTLRSAAAIQLNADKTGPATAIRTAFALRSKPMVLGSLAALGIAQAAAGTAPIGDDIWHYTEVADALLTSHPYPIATISPALVNAGMAPTYPALPLFPGFLALSFLLFGRNLVGVALPTMAATALFPLALYAACKAITGNSFVAYAVAVLAFLFPVYQIHILGAPQPDTVFVTLLLLGATLAVKANSSRQRRYWIGMGAVMGLVTLTRHEGMAYSLVLFLTFLVVHRANPNYWWSVATCLATLAPFAAFYRSMTGSLWPSTFGTGILSWDHLSTNLSILRSTSLGWFAQAIGVGEATLVVLLAAAAALVALGGLAMARRSLALLFIPVAGAGNLAAGLFMHPLVVYSPYPVEFLRHVSYGIPFVVLTLAYTGHLALQWATKTSGALKPILVVAVLLLVSGTAYYEAERLARPEWYFGGKSSLLWTGSGYLFADILQHPVPLPAPGDPRSGEQVREDLTRPIEASNLRTVNLSEPYHWASLALVLFGLGFASTSLRDTRPPR